MSHHYKFHNDCQSSVLTYEQVKRLDYVMDQPVPIHGRGNFPTLYVKLKELIRLVKHKLQKEHSIEIRDVRLNGGGANYVLAPENSHYNDLDLVFGTDLSNEDQFDVIRDVVLECLKEFYPKEPSSRGTTTNCSSSGSSSISRCCGNQQQQQNIEKESQFNATSINDGASSSTGSNDQVMKVQDKGNNESRQTCDKIDNQQQQQQASSSSSSSSSIQNDARLNNSNIKKGEEQQQQQLKKITNEESESVAAVDDDHNRTTTIETACCGERRRQQQTTNSSNYELASLGSAKQQQSNQMPLNNCAIKEAYVHKMVKVNDDDRWSLISLGVQQSEVNGGQVVNGAGGGQHVGSAAGHRANEKYFPALPPNEKNLNKDHQFSNANSSMQQATGIGGDQMVGEVLIANNIGTQQHLAHSYHHNPHQQQNNHHYQHQQRPKQFPNSIELKFVDRMRRKFEFSVDSFQIILDSLIQFYDYAPKPSSIISQRDLMNSHPSSTVINTRPMIMSKRRCSTDCCSANSDCVTLGHRMESNFDGYNRVRVQRDSFSAGSDQRNNSGSLNCHHQHKSGKFQHHSSSSTPSSDNKFNAGSMAANCVGPLAGPQSSYYKFQLDAQSPSLTSEASSSGCSSSSSVVSSSSSSLSSCDEDNEDLYCDVDGQSSSSASTSSLLSSSVYSSDDGVACNSAPDQQPSSSGCESIIDSSKSKKLNQSTSKGDRSSQKGPQVTDNKVPSSKVAVPKQTATRHFVPSSGDIVNGCCSGCCLDLTNNYGDNEYDFETDDSTSCAVISENFYPTVIGRSEYGNFKEALYHLEKKLIATRSPEEIRGGGLLKYCNLLVKNYKPTNVYQIRTLERYMCSRFFIDFSDLNQQQAKLESYLANHFSDDLPLKIDYLTILHNVVQRSTVCLMNHELRLTLEMIRDMAFKMSEQQQQQQQQRQGHLNQLHQQQRAVQMQQSQNQAASQIDMVAAAAQQHQHPSKQKNQQVQAKQFFGVQQHPKPLLIQSGIYRVKLVNYSLAKPAATTK